MNSLKKILFLHFSILSFALFSQKLPVQGKLFEVVNTQSWGVHPHFLDLISADNGNFWWPREVKTKQIDSPVYSKFQIELRSGKDLSLKDSLKLGPTFHLSDADSDSLGNLFILGYYKDTLLIKDSIYSSLDSGQAVVIKIGLDLEVETFNLVDQLPSQISVSKDGQEFYLLVNQYRYNRRSGLFHYTKDGSLLKSKWFDQLNLKKIEFRRDKGLYFTVQCGAINKIDTVNIIRYSNFNLFYGSLDSNLNAKWLKQILHPCINESTVLNEGPNSSLIMGNSIHEGFSFYGNQIGVGDGSANSNVNSDIFINSHSQSGGIKYFIDAQTNDVAINFRDLDYSDYRTTVLAVQFHTNTIYWSSNMKTESEETNMYFFDPVIIEIDTHGIVNEVSSFPKSQASTAAIFYASDSNIIELGRMMGAYLRIAGDTIKPTEFSDTTSFLYLRRWSFPSTIGLSEKYHKTKPLNIYPNPSAASFQFNRVVEEGYVYDLEGRHILTIKHDKEIELTHHKKGVYILKEKDGGSHKLLLN